MSAGLPSVDSRIIVEDDRGRTRGRDGSVSHDEARGAEQEQLHRSQEQEEHGQDGDQELHHDAPPLVAFDAVHEAPSAERITASRQARRMKTPSRSVGDSASGGRTVTARGTTSDATETSVRFSSPRRASIPTA